MSFRVAARRVPTLALARPTVAPRAATSVAAIRLYSDKPSPEARASSILDALPGNSLVSKTGWVTLGTGLTAVAISKEIYVANEETVILVGSLIFAVLVGRAITGPYKEWADSQIEVRLCHTCNTPSSSAQLSTSYTLCKRAHARHIAIHLFSFAAKEIVCMLCRADIQDNMIKWKAEKKK